MTDWWIADTHFFHDKILSFGGRNFDSIGQHNQIIRDNWNSKVKPNDKIYHVGDVILGAGHISKNHEVLDLLASLNGKKILISGNHDNFPKIKIYQNYFDKIIGCMEYKQKFICTHIPVHPQELEYRFKFNIHGHLHSNNIKLPNGEIDKKYINVSCEQINYTPISFEEIRNNLKKNDI